jgi:hypothetical protein
MSLETYQQTINIKNMKINQHGYWEEVCSHHTDKGLKESLLSLVSNLESIVDFGCGDASYVKYLLENSNIKAKAFDGNPNVKQITNNLAEQLDLAQPFNLGKKFDAVISLEVAEHIPKEYESVYVNNLCKHTNKYLIISWAVPGQGGKGHVNEQTNQYVIDLFSKLNFKYKLEYSNYLRNSITNCNWFKNTILVFEHE